MKKLKLNKQYVLISIVLLAIIMGVIWWKVFSQQSSSYYVKYEIDGANRCGWEKGKIVTETLIGSVDPNPIKMVKKSDENSFLKSAEAEGRCVYRLD